MNEFHPHKAALVDLLQLNPGQLDVLFDTEIDAVTPAQLNIVVDSATQEWLDDEQSPLHLVNDDGDLKSWSNESELNRELPLSEAEARRVSSDYIQHCRTAENQYKPVAIAYQDRLHGAAYLCCMVGQDENNTKVTTVQVIQSQGVATTDDECSDLLKNQVKFVRAKEISGRSTYELYRDIQEDSSSQESTVCAAISWPAQHFTWSPVNASQPRICIEVDLHLSLSQDMDPLIRTACVDWLHLFKLNEIRHGRRTIDQWPSSSSTKTGSSVKFGEWSKQYRVPNNHDFISKLWDLLVQSISLDDAIETFTATVNALEQGQFHVTCLPEGQSDISMLLKQCKECDMERDVNVAARKKAELSRHFNMLLAGHANSEHPIVVTMINLGISKLKQHTVNQMRDLHIMTVDEIEEAWNRCDTSLSKQILLVHVMLRTLYMCKFLSSSIHFLDESHCRAIARNALSHWKSDNFESYTMFFGSKHVHLLDFKNNTATYALVKNIETSYRPLKTTIYASNGSRSYIIRRESTKLEDMSLFTADDDEDLEEDTLSQTPTNYKVSVATITRHEFRPTN